MASAAYLELLKRCLTGEIYAETYRPVDRPKGRLKAAVHDQIRSRGIELMRRSQIQPTLFEDGRADWLPSFVDTMVGRKRLDNVQRSMEDVLERNVPGDFIEAGVWRGGTTIFMRGVLRAHGVSDRRVWAADSFRGLPPPDADAYPADAGDLHHTYDWLSVPLETVRSNFARYGLLDDQVRFLEGWFRDTLPTTVSERWAVIRLDGDMYESTMDALRALYPNLSVGGYLIVDDYGGIEACRRAIDDYRADHGIDEPLHEVDWTGVYWRRER